LQEQQVSKQQVHAVGAVYKLVSSNRLYRLQIILRKQSTAD